MKKWVIIGVIIGLIGPIAIPTIYPTLFELAGGPFSIASDRLEKSLLILFPFSFCMLDSETMPLYIQHLLYAIVSLLNIGLFIFLSLMLRRICLFAKNLQKVPK